MIANGLRVALSQFHECLHQTHLHALDRYSIRATDDRDVRHHEVVSQTKSRKRRQAIEQVPKVTCDGVRHVTKLGAFFSAHHYEEVRIHCSVDFRDYHEGLAANTLG
jgi:hypothetical protein